MAYGTYEFTSYAIMKAWKPRDGRDRSDLGHVSDRRLCLGRGRPDQDDIQRPAMILYGISTCDTCKKALKALDSAGKSVTFRDIRAQPLSEAGNRQDRAGIWRPRSEQAVHHLSWLQRFPESLGSRGAKSCLQPAVMKRPVIDADGKFYLGWDDAVQAALL